MGTVTVTSGVVTVAVVARGIVTVAAVTGVETVTVAPTVGTDSVGSDTGSLGSETVGTRSAVGDSDGVVASAVGEAEPALAVEPSAVLRRRRTESWARVPRGVRPAPCAGLPGCVARAAIASDPIGATTCAVTIPAVARPAATTTAAAPFTAATCGTAVRFNHRDSPRPAAVTPRV